MNHVSACDNPMGDEKMKKIVRLRGLRNEIPRCAQSVKKRRLVCC